MKVARFIKLMQLTLVITVTGVVAASGCQVSENGQTIPSPSYLDSDYIQYFPPGPEFKLSREAAALQAARAQEKSDRR